MGAAELRTGKNHRDENFPVASLLLAREHRRPILAFYRFARVADDVADHPDLSPEQKLAMLDRLEAALDGAANQEPEATDLRTILDARGLSDDNARLLLHAFRQDATTKRYHSWLELMDYCAYSAMPVGRFVLDLHGEPRAARTASDAVCAALQIINHLQDCARDYRQLDRVYLPLDLMTHEGARVEDLGAHRATNALRAVILTLTNRADDLLDRGEAITAQIRNARLAREIQVIVALARNNVVKLRREDPLQDGGRTSKSSALLITLATLLRSLSPRANPLHKRTADDTGL